MVFNFHSLVRLAGDLPMQIKELYSGALIEYAHDTISVGFLIKYRFFGNTLSTLGEHTLRIF